jgi:hypothetical protein
MGSLGELFQFCLDCDRPTPTNHPVSLCGLFQLCLDCDGSTPSSPVAVPHDCNCLRFAASSPLAPALPTLLANTSSSAPPAVVSRRLALDESNVEIHTDFTPYGNQYGVNPKFFDFGLRGEMLPVVKRDPNVARTLLFAGNDTTLDNRLIAAEQAAGKAESVFAARYSNLPTPGTSSSTPATPRYMQAASSGLGVSTDVAALSSSNSLMRCALRTPHEQLVATRGSGAAGSRSASPITANRSASSTIAAAQCPCHIAMHGLPDGRSAATHGGGVLAGASTPRRSPMSAGLVVRADRFSDKPSTPYFMQRWLGKYDNVAR